MAPWGANASEWLPKWLPQLGAAVAMNRITAGQTVEAMGIEPTNLLHAMQALYQLSYAPGWRVHDSSGPQSVPEIRRCASTIAVPWPASTTCRRWRAGGSRVGAT